MLETWVQSLVREDPLEKEMAMHSSILAWKIPWTEESGGLQSMGSQTDMTERQALFWKLKHEIMVSGESDSGESPLPGCRVLTFLYFHMTERGLGSSLDSLLFFTFYLYWSIAS